MLLQYRELPNLPGAPAVWSEVLFQASTGVLLDLRPS